MIAVGLSGDSITDRESSKCLFWPTVGRSGGFRGQKAARKNRGSKWNPIGTRGPFSAGQ